MHKESLPKQEVVSYLAHCIRAAELCNGGSLSCSGWRDSSDEYYWHTRESVMDVGREYNISIPEILLEYNRLVQKWIVAIPPEENPFWLDTAHPSIIIGEVHSS